MRADAAEAAAQLASNSAVSAGQDAQAASALANQMLGTVTQVLQDVRDIAGGDLTDFAKNSENLSGLSDVQEARENLGLGNVDNTADLDKPVSRATAEALATKLDVVEAATTFNNVNNQLAQKAAAVHSHSWGEVTDKPATATRWPAWSEVTGKPATFPSSNHSHPWNDVTDKPATATRWPGWDEVTSKPSTFPPSSHTHSASQVTGLGTAATKNITVSTANPSGGVDGDIWFKV